MSGRTLMYDLNYFAFIFFVLGMNIHVMNNLFLVRNQYIAGILLLITQLVVVYLGREVYNRLMNRLRHYEN